jgi:hypothetical protein
VILSVWMDVSCRQPMQSSFPHAAGWLLYLVIGALCCGCYPHAGAPFRAGEDEWDALAKDACERGDLLAFQTLIERTEREEECVYPSRRPLKNDTTEE